MSLHVPLDALDGISFVIDSGGTIGAVSSQRWNAFAFENGAAELLDKSVLGRNLFEFVSGSDVQSHLKRIMKELGARSRPAFVLPFSCDGPNRQRNMRQSISPIFADARCSGFLFQSIELESRQRPPIDLYDFKAIEKRASEDHSLPLIVMCSWCQRVRSKPTTDDRWMMAQDYYAAGGGPEVRISHGICELCAKGVDP